MAAYWPPVGRPEVAGDRVERAVASPTWRSWRLCDLEALETQ